MIASLADFSAPQQTENEHDKITEEERSRIDKPEPCIKIQPPDSTQEHFVQVGDICNNCRTAQLVAAEAREKFDYRNPIEIWPGRPDFMKKKVMRVIR